MEKKLFKKLKVLQKKQKKLAKKDEESEDSESNTDAGHNENEHFKFNVPDSMIE